MGVTSQLEFSVCWVSLLGSRRLGSRMPLRPLAGSVSRSGLGMTPCFRPPGTWAWPTGMSWSLMAAGFQDDVADGDDKNA